MTRPDTLTTTTVGQTREKYRKNQKALDNVLLLTTTGSFTDWNDESIVNTFMRSLVVEQEDIRERERKKLGMGS